ncbi:MAG TPA: hypothetical protein DCE41_36455 [Cytophagales bacterium]|nr:hypothetical protein [Cytophagales bacterium]HAA17292.1 hypothetical protein [Cytophagales bacterium]HAP59918.1 hypothetical protein [Cytophagales bacterium]
MPIEYDIESDSFYKEGLEKGVENTKLAMIENMLKNGVLTIAQIAEIAETTEEAVQKIAEGL